MEKKIKIILLLLLFLSIITFLMYKLKPEGLGLIKYIEPGIKNFLERFK